MKTRMKRFYKAAVSLLLSTVLFAMPAAAFNFNCGNSLDVKAQELETEAESETETESTTQEQTEEETETESTVSDGDETEEPECTCTEKCSAYEKDADCPVCAENYKECAYKTPNVVISINKPDGWYNESATVTFSATDAAHTGNFELVEMKAKVGQNGSWTDVTEDKRLSVSENCTVYVQVTDQNGNTYEKNRSIRCFDTTKPTLNAAVSDGLLTVQVSDTDSGAKAVYVNGYEFTDLTNGTLNIRLQQFDAGYEYFTISAMDNAGNMSEVYKTKNPYYTTDDEDSDENAAEQLPESAEATSPGSATAAVTEHTVTDSSGNTTADTAESIAEQKKQALAEADAAEAAESGETEDSTDATVSETGKEFYTIQTESDKVFYLVIDRDGDEETVYFLTEITENDLLNVTSDNSETLPKNSAAVESAIPTTEESALSNNNDTLPEEQTDTAETAGDTESTESMEDMQTEPQEQEKESSPVVPYLLMGAAGAAVIGGAYYFKVVRKKKEDFIEDEDDDEDEEDEELVNEDDDADSDEDDFFDNKEGE